MFCKHKWKILSENTTQSRFEQYADLTDRVPNPRNLWQLEEGTRKKLIQLVTCDTCGKIKKFVENI
jgi:predicted nucleic acid-binding OB-fold protein